MMEQSMWKTGYVMLPLAKGGLMATRQEHCQNMWEALVGLSKNLHGEDSDFAAGTRLDAKGVETIYIEHKNGSQIARVEIRPNKARASIANAAMGMAISKVKDIAEIASAVWYAYLAFDPSGSPKQDLKDLHELTEKIYEGLEEDEIEDFEIALNNYEAKAMLVNGPITGKETSIPILDKKVQGPGKIISGEFVTFPLSGSAVSAKPSAPKTRDAVKEFLLDSEMIRNYRDKLSADQKARVPDVRETHMFGENECYAYKVLKQTENDRGDLAVRVVQVTGPAAAGKSEAVEQFAANNGLPFYSVVTNESTRFDQLLDSWVPYLTGGELPTFTSEEDIVNAALKADTEGRDALAIAIEALDLPSPIEVKFDPDYAWEVLGRSGSPAPAQEIISKIEEKANAVLSSLKKKIESADTGGLTLAYKCVPSPLTSWCKNGGVLEIGEMATMRKGELSKLHDLLDFNRKGSIMTAEGECFRHEACYCFLTNNLEYDEDHPLTLPMISRMSLDIEFPQLTEEEAVERLISNLGCESKRVMAKELVHAYVALGKEATNLSLPGGIDFRNLKQIANRILIHDFDPRKVFEKEVIHHFVQHSDPESKTSDETALLGLLDELELFR